MDISLAWSVADGVAEETTLSVPTGATALDAIRAGGLLDGAADIDPSTQVAGVWGRACALSTVLKPGDRVEVYRPLAMDPKEARRQRATRR